MRRRITFVFVFSVSCSGLPEGDIRYALDVPTCETATQEIFDYARDRAEEYFGDRDFEADWWVVTPAQKTELCPDFGYEIAACAIYTGVILPCQQTQRDTCLLLMHEFTHLESFRRYNDWDEKHERFKAYEAWQNESCAEDRLDVAFLRQ